MGEAIITRRGGAGGSSGEYVWRKQNRVLNNTLVTSTPTSTKSKYKQASTATGVTATVYEDYIIDSHTGLFVGVGTPATINYNTASNYVGWYDISDDGRRCYRVSGTSKQGIYYYLVCDAIYTVDTTIETTDLGFVLSDEADTYPDGDYHTDGYYYIEAGGEVRFGEAFAFAPSNSAASFEYSPMVISTAAGSYETSTEGFYVSEDDTPLTYEITEGNTPLLLFIQAVKFNSTTSEDYDPMYLYLLHFKNSFDTHIIDADGDQFKVSLDIMYDDEDRLRAYVDIERLEEGTLSCTFYIRGYPLLS